MSSQPLTGRRTEAVYARALGRVRLDDGNVDAVLAAASHGVQVVLAGVDDAAATVDRLAGRRVGGIVVADPHRALLADNDRWQQGWSSVDTEPFESWVGGYFWRSGIGSMLVEVVTHGSALGLPSWAAHSTHVRDEAANGSTLVGILAELVDNRSNGAVPSIDESPGWCLTIGPGGRPAPVAATLLALSSGVLGVRGDLEDRSGIDHFVMVAGAYGPGADGLVRPLPGPAVTVLDDADSTPPSSRHVLDLHTGVLAREPIGDGLRSVRFVSLTHPGVFALRAEDHHAGTTWPDPITPPAVTTGPAAAFDYSAGRCGSTSCSASTARRGHDDGKPPTSRSTVTQQHSSRFDMRCSM